MSPLDPADVAAWLIRAVATFPIAVEDRLVAVRIGVQPQHVHAVRNHVAPARDVRTLNPKDTPS